MRWLNSITHSIDMCLRKLQEIVKDTEAWRAAVHDITKSWRQHHHSEGHPERFTELLREEGGER